MSEYEYWYKVLKLARSSAADDLNISNEILDIAERLNQINTNTDLSEEKISRLSNDLIKQSLKLANKSKDMNYAIAKLAGTI